MPKRIRNRRNAEVVWKWDACTLGIVTLGIVVFVAIIVFFAVAASRPLETTPIVSGAQIGTS